MSADVVFEIVILVTLLFGWAAISMMAHLEGRDRWLLHGALGSFSAVVLLLLLGTFHGPWTGITTGTASLALVLLLSCLFILSHRIRRKRKPQLHKHFEAVAQQLSEVLWQTNSAGELVFLSKQAERRWGLKREEAEGAPFCDLFLQEDQGELRAFMEGLQANNHSQELQLSLRIEDENGRICHVELIASPVLEGGELAGAIGVLRDIRAGVDPKKESAQADQALLQSQKMEAIGRLAGGIAHDFNNMLTSILSTANVLEMDIHDSELLDAVKDIQNAATSAAELTKQLLAFSRKRNLSLTQVELGAALRSSIKMLERTIGEDISLKVQIPDEEYWTLADRVALEQVTFNLAINARDAMEKGGELWIRLIDSQELDLEDERLSELADEKYVALEIEDDGIGMTPEILEHVFEPFFTTKPVNEGTGLGLSIAYSIIAQHKGKMLIESTLGVGTKISCYLPVYGKSAVMAAIEAIDTSPGGGEMILLIEDEDQVRQIAARLLRRIGYRVVEASFGLEAIECFTQHKIDLVITDVVMPGLFGPEVVEELRGLRPDLPVLFTSGYAQEKLNETALDYQTKYLAKPYDEKKLGNAIHKLLESARRGPESSE